MSTPPAPQHPRGPPGDDKKVATPSITNIVTRNGARKAKIQTRAMSAGAKPSPALLAAKKKGQQKKKFTPTIDIRDPYQVAMDCKTKVKGPTGFVTEPRMAEHHCLWDENYPECPERLIKVIERCNELNLIEQCKQFQPRAATKEELCVLHSTSLYDMMEETKDNQDIEYLEELSSKYDAIYIHPSTQEMARVAAGCTIDMVEAVVRGEVQNGAVMVRPPGHHAMRAEPCGYCFYNNVALAAHHALARCRLDRVLIVDWDVHHGQATQQMFYEDPRVLYFSVHRYEHGAFWPGLRQADFMYTGAGRGAGFTCNVPLNATGATDADYFAIWHQLLLPMAIEGEMRLSPACYAHLVAALQAVCARVVCVLEGGYCVPALAQAAALTLRTLLGQPPPPPPRPPRSTHSPQVRETILNCIYVQRRHWKCFEFQPTYGAKEPAASEAAPPRHEVSAPWAGDERRPERFPTRHCYPVQEPAARAALLDQLQRWNDETDLSVPPHDVGYVYDEAMLEHRNLSEPGHPECPERLVRVHERLRDFGLLERMTPLAAAPATDDEILALHDAAYLDRLKSVSGLSAAGLRAETARYSSVYLHGGSLRSAAAAAGGVLAAVRAVLRGAVRSALCAVRPPGHHAGAAAPAGFCLLNNAALAAHHAAAAGRRVLLLDWDVHHGDGTQRLTYRSDQILYVSIHRYDRGSFFPHSKDADHTAVGDGPGEGYNVNVPWNKRGMGDSEYLAAFCQIVLPIAYEFRPDLVIVSAGFDACAGDPLGGCAVSPECFGRLTALLRPLAGGRLVLALEGGYNLTATALAFALCGKALLGDPAPPARPAPPPCASAVRSIRDVLAVHSAHWRSLDFHRALPEEDVLGAPPPSRGLPPAAGLEGAMGRLRLQGADEGRAGGSRAAGEEPRTLAEYLAQNARALADGEMFAVVPLAGCPHVAALPAPPAELRLDERARCHRCDETYENWLCLHCYVTACGRYVRGHLQQHHAAAGHALALSLADVSVWCSACDAYVDAAALWPVRDRLHVHKFGERLPWTYGPRDPPASADPL